MASVCRLMCSFRRAAANGLPFLSSATATFPARAALAWDGSGYGVVWMTSLSGKAESRFGVLGGDGAHTPLAQRAGIDMKASRIGPHQRAAEQALAAKQLEITPVAQGNQLVAVAVGFQHGATCDQVLVGRRGEPVKTCVDSHRVGRQWRRPG